MLRCTGLSCVPQYGAPQVYSHLHLPWPFPTPMLHQILHQETHYLRPHSLLISGHLRPLLLTLVFRSGISFLSRKGTAGVFWKEVFPWQRGLTQWQFCREEYQLPAELWWRCTMQEAAHVAHVWMWYTGEITAFKIFAAPLRVVHS